MFGPLIWDELAGSSVCLCSSWSKGMQGVCFSNYYRWRSSASQKPVDTSKGRNKSKRLVLHTLLVNIAVHFKPDSNLRQRQVHLKDTSQAETEHREEFGPTGPRTVPKQVNIHSQMGLSTPLSLWTPLTFVTHLIGTLITWFLWVPN